MDGSNPMTTLRRLQFRAVSAAVRGSTRICPWTHTVPAVHRRSHPADRARAHRRHEDMRFCRPMESQPLMKRTVTCISDVAGWMSSNRLQLNTAKIRSTLVRFLSPAAPHPEFQAASLRRHQTRKVRSRPRDIAHRQ